MFDFLPERGKGTWFKFYFLSLLVGLGLTLAGGFLSVIMYGSQLLPIGMILLLIIVVPTFILPSLMGLMGGRIFFGIAVPALWTGCLLSGFLAVDDIAGWEIFVAAMVLSIFGIGGGILGILCEVTYRLRGKKPLAAKISKSMMAVYLLVLFAISVAAIVTSEDPQIIGNPDYVDNIEVLDGVDLEEALLGEAETIGMLLTVDRIDDDSRADFYRLNGFCVLEHYEDDYMIMKFTPESLGEASAEVLGLIKLMITVLNPDMDETAVDDLMLRMIFRDVDPEGISKVSDLPLDAWPSGTYGHELLLYHFSEDTPGQFEMHIEDARMGH